MLDPTRNVMPRECHPTTHRSRPVACSISPGATISVAPAVGEVCTPRHANPRGTAFCSSAACIADAHASETALAKPMGCLKAVFGQGRSVSRKGSQQQAYKCARPCNPTCAAQAGGTLLASAASLRRRNTTANDNGNAGLPTSPHTGSTRITGLRSPAAAPGKLSNQLLCCLGC